MTLTAPTTSPDAAPAGPPTRWVPPRARAAVAVVAAAAAFAPSLSGLVADLRYGAPTGDLVAVPVVAAVMLDAAVRSRRTIWAGRLGHGDLVVAGGLGLAALLLVLLPAGRVTNGHWLTRLDLLAHPVALAAFAVLLLGLRVLAVAVLPLTYALLVWPWPVTWLNLHAIGPLTRLTYEASGRAAELLGVAEMVDVGAENTLRIGAGDTAFEVAVAPACSGVAGIVAYLVVAGAVLALCRGPLRGRALWLGSGLLAVWLGNVVRVVALAAAGEAWGADVALDLLHPVAGLAVDAVVVVVMVTVMARFGLSWAPVVRTTAGTVGTIPASAAFTAPVAPPSGRSLAVRGGLVVALAAVLFVADLRVVGSLEGAVSATPRRSVTLGDVERVGAGASFLGREDWSRIYFGRGSVWNRYRVSSATSATTGSVWLDSLVVDDDDALRAHDVLTCYSFHGARVTEGGAVLVAGRFSARLLVITTASGEQWQSLFWEWPVATAHGLRHERVTLFAGGAPAPTRGGSPSGGATSRSAPTGSGAASPGGGVDPELSAMLQSAADRVASGALGLPEDGTTS
ncbi:MAG: archaeosortase/exosortase family protein [Kineosporiaceae bacterium]